MTATVLADPLTQTIGAVQAELRQASDPPIATFAVDTVLLDGYRTQIQIRDFPLIADEPEKIGGADTGPTPVELVLAGLGSCQEIVFATYARVLGIPVDSVRVHTEGRLDLRGFFGVADVPSGFQDVTYDVEIQSSATVEDIARLVSAVNAHCPVLDILRQPVTVTGSYTLNGAAIEVA